MPSSPISPCPSCLPHAAGGHGCAVYSSSVTDAQWAILEPLLPAPGSTAGRGGRPEKHCRRAIVDAILYIVRGGIAWRQLPVELPPAGKRCSVDYDLQRRGALLPRFPPRPTRTRRGTPRHPPNACPTHVVAAPHSIRPPAARIYAHRPMVAGATSESRLVPRFPATREVAPWPLDGSHRPAARRLATGNRSPTLLRWPKRTRPTRLHLMLVSF